MGAYRRRGTQVGIYTDASVYGLGGWREINGAAVAYLSVPLRERGAFARARVADAENQTSNRTMIRSLRDLDNICGSQLLVGNI